MRPFLCAAVAAALLATAACRSTTVHGASGESFTSTTDRSMSIRRGTSVPLAVDIDRQNFTGPVTVSISQLPHGVVPDRSSLHVETTSATFILKAADSADLVSNQAVGVTVEDTSGRKSLQYVSLTVTN
jgi:hypothetical protein